MAQKPEDFNLPMSAIKKILKDSVPNGVHITEGAKLALSKAASVFVLYATTGANGFAQDNNRKRVLGKDVIDALVDLDLGFLVPPLHAALAEYHKSTTVKKQTKEEKGGKTGDDDDNAEEIPDHSMEVQEVHDEVIVIDSDSSESEGGNASSDCPSVIELDD